MKICVAQTRPIKGDITKNSENHKNLIHLAVSNGADMIIFPELSLTGYEPELAKSLALDKEDTRLDDFQKISDTKQITIGVGAPIKAKKGVNIGMFIFQPNQARQIYFKKYLHTSEDAFFISGKNTIGLIGDKRNIALAICYELSVPEHSENAYKNGAEIYIASVVEDTIDKAIKKLSDIAQKYAMTVFLANCAGQTGAYACNGKTAIWNNKGVLKGQLDETHEGVLMMDTKTQEVVKITILKNDFFP